MTKAIFIEMKNGGGHCKGGGFDLLVAGTPEGPAAIGWPIRS